MGITTDENLIAEAGRRLAVAAPDAKVILFGSHARGDARLDSDLDLLVIEPEVKSRREEFVRLREALGNLGVQRRRVLHYDSIFAWRTLTTGATASFQSRDELGHSSPGRVRPFHGADNEARFAASLSFLSLVVRSETLILGLK